jgi:DNA-binding GntR family transcriptional regulator
MVAVLTVRDIEETYAIREALESVAASLAAERVTPEAADRLDAIVEEAEASLANLDVLTMVGLDQQFHAEIAAMSENARLAKLLETMRTADFLGPGRPHRSSHPVSVEEHRGIAAAIRAGNGGDAEARMRSHIRSSAAFIAETIFGARVGHD